MRTAFIGAYGYGNLGDELCLIEAMRSFPSREAYAFTVDADWTGRCVPGLAGTFRDLEGLLAIQPERVVFGGGGIGTLPGLDIYTRWMRAAQLRGAVCHIHNIGVGNLQLDWIDAERREFFSRLASFTVRDHKSVEMVAKWGIGRLPGVSAYPEHRIEPDFSLADQILPRNRTFIGISSINYDMTERCLVTEAERIAALLRRYRGMPVVPIVSQVHRAADGRNDAAGFRLFAERFLQGVEILAPDMLDRDWWYANLTPRRLKGVIARCRLLISQRKHNCIHGIGAGVPTIGFFPARDDSVPRTFVTLANILPPESRLFGLRDEAQAGAGTASSPPAPRLSAAA